MRVSKTLFFLPFVIVLTGVASGGFAHDPLEHGFKLVTFEPPSIPPDFRLVDLNGEPAELGNYRNQYVLLNFWATWCPPCVAEMPALEQLFQRYRERGFVVVAVSSDVEGRSIVQPFIENLGVTFPVLLDPDGKVSATYGAKSLPVSFLLDRNGRVVAAAEGAREWYSESAIEALDEIILP